MLPVLAVLFWTVIPVAPGFVLLGVWLSGSTGALSAGAVGAVRSWRRNQRLDRIALGAAALGLLELILLAWLTLSVVEALRNPPSIPL